MTSAQVDVITALVAFQTRKLANANIVQKNNSSMPAGSPMYYYCRTCSAEMVLPEEHREPAPRHCDDCKVLMDNNWMPELLVRMKQPLRILQKSVAGSNELCRLGMTFPIGELVGLGPIEKNIYDHRDQDARPVLCPLIRRDIFVLVDELQAAVE